MIASKALSFVLALVNWSDFSPPRMGSDSQHRLLENQIV